jgi:hypothetical protein
LDYFDDNDVDDGYDDNGVDDHNCVDDHNGVDDGFKIQLGYVVFNYIIERKLEAFSLVALGLSYLVQ